jgi:hypothetical protein
MAIDSKSSGLLLQDSHEIIWKGGTILLPSPAGNGGSYVGGSTNNAHFMCEINATKFH